MDAERWNRLETLFLEARERPAGEIRGFLDDACGADEILRDEVLSLLNADETGAHLMNAPALGEDFHAGAVADEIEQADRTRIGQRLGAYRLTELIKTGGMGAVYLAVRADDAFEKRVAVKLTRAGITDPKLLELFRQERQVLADLEHPNIARLLDGATTREGLPYLVMEYIDGQPIDRWCDEHCASVRERLTLFQQVCEAVRFAHRNLIVHRDIKPANILVTPDGTPKLLDFGVAKMLASNAKEPTHHFLSPAYASPEQIRGDPITTSADIHSLGTVLYLLLAGRKPCEAGTKSSRQAAFQLSDEEPTRLSEAVSGEDLSQAEVARLRRTSPAGLRRLLAGDLDAIVVQALRKNPDERYASVEQLSVDIQRHLDDLPVLAHRPTLGYRATKFVRRNWKGLTFAAALLLALVGGVIGTTVQAHRAERAAEDTGRALSNLVHLLPAIDPARRNEVSATELRRRLDEASDLLERELLDEPEKRAEALETLATAYSGLGMVGRARPLLEEVLAIRERTLEPSDPELARTMYELAGAVWSAGEFDRSEELLGRALSIQEAALGPESLAAATTLERLARVNQFSGDVSAADRFFREAMDIKRRRLVTPHPDLAASLMTYSTFLHDVLRDNETSEAYLDEARAMFGELRMGDHLGLAAELIVVGTWLQDRTTRYEEAEAYMREGLAMLERLVPPDHPSIAGNKALLGLLLKDMGRYGEAERMMRRALDGTAEFHGESSLATAEVHTNMGKVLCDKGEFERAEEHVQRAIEIQREEPGAGKIRLAIKLTQLGQIRNGRGDFEGAEVALRESKEIQSVLPEHHWERAKTDSLLGEALYGQGRFAEAEPLVVQSFTIIEADRGPDQHRTLQALQRLVGLYAAWGRPEEAARHRADLEGRMARVQAERGSVELARCRGLVAQVYAPAP